MADFNIVTTTGTTTGPAIDRFQFTQGVASTTWTINHGLSNSRALLYFFDDEAKINVVTVVNTSANTITVTFDTPTTGTVQVISPRPEEIFVFDASTNPQTSFTIEHGLDDLYPVVQSYVDGSMVIPDTYKVINENTVFISFGSAFDGEVVIHSVSPEYSNVIRSVYTQIVASDTWLIEHNHNAPYPLFTFYDANSDQIYPNDVIFLDDNVMIVNWEDPIIGSAVVTHVRDPFNKSCGTAGTGIDTSEDFADSFVYKNESPTAIQFTVTHNLDDVLPLVEVYDISGNLIKVDEIIVADANNVQIQLLQPQECTVKVTTVRGRSAFISIQASPINIWCIPHGFGDLNVTVQFYDLFGKQIIPDSITNIEPNTTEAFFQTPQTGRAKVVVMRNRINSVSSYTHNQTFISNIWLVNHNMRDRSPILACYDLSGNYLIPNDVLIVDENNLTVTFDTAFRGYIRLITTEENVPDVVILDRFTSRFKSIVPFIAKQFPEFARAYDYAPSSTAKSNILVTFMEAYYEWLERNLPLDVQQDNIQNQINNADLIFSLEYGVQRFFELYRNTYLESIPYFFQNRENVNPALLIKIIRSFYLTKGTKKAVSFLFNFLFNDPTATISYFNPRLLTSNTALTTTRSFVRVFFTPELSTDDNYKLLLGRTLTGQMSFTRMTVQGFRIFNIGQQAVLEIEVSNLSGNLIVGERLTASISNVVGNQTVTVVFDLITYVIAGKFTIVNGGTGYEPFRTITVGTPGNGSGFSAQIAEVDANGAITQIRIDDPGINQTIPPILDLTNLGDGNAIVTIQSSAEYSNTSIGNRFSGNSNQVPRQFLRTIFTDYNSRFTVDSGEGLQYVYYPSIEDFGPNKLHGVIVGNNVIPFSTDTNVGLKFTGLLEGSLSGGVNCGISNTLGPIGNWTLEVKFRPDLQSRTMSVVGKWGTLTVDKHFVIQIDENNRLVGQAVLFGANIVSIVDPVPLTVDSDVDASLVWDGSSLYLFKNGNLVDSTPFAKMQLPSPNTSFWIGRDDDDRNASQPSPFSGTIYSVRLSSTDLYVSGYTPVDTYEVDSRTLSLYELDEKKAGLTLNPGTVLASAPEEYTYYITSQTPISEYRDILKNTVHPAGMLFIGRFVILSGDANTNRAEMFHYFHPDDANFNSPNYSSSRFFKVLTLKLALEATEGDTSITSELKEVFHLIKMRPTASLERLGRVQVIDDYGAFLIDLFNTYTYPATFTRILPVREIIDPNSPNRTQYESFGHYPLNHFRKYTTGGSEVTLITI